MNRAAHITETKTIQRRYEKKYFPLTKAAIQNVVDSTMSAVSQGGPTAGKRYLDNKLNNPQLTEIVQQMVLEVGLRFARRTYVDLNVQKRSAKGFIARVPSLDAAEHKAAGFGFNQTWADWIQRYLFDFIVQKISFSVFETTKDQLFTVLNRAISEGWGVDETVKALDQLPLSSNQAARLVRTEITRATNAGTMAASQTFPFQQNKEWLSAHDDRVRGTNRNDHASHVALDGQVVDYENVFIDPRNGDELRFPGDPRASAESTINCRCSVAPIAKTDMNGRLLPKRTTTSVIFPTTRRQTIVTI